jgi:DeoR family fructose operon transcriptional repressor
MLIAERRRRLLEQVRQRGYASFRELADTLGISESTVRRDLRQLVAEGLLEATRGGVGLLQTDTTRETRPLSGAHHGAGQLPGAGALPGGNRQTGPAFRSGADGAAPAPGPTDGANGWADGATGWADGGTGWADGATSSADGWAALVDGITGPDTDGLADDPLHRERQAIAAHAASLVKPGSAILLGPGRTTYLLARELTTISSLTVVTNSVLVTHALLRAPQIDVVMVGGALRRSIGALVGPATEQALQGLRGDHVFLSGEGVTVDRGLTTPNVFAAATDQALMAAGRRVVVLADHTKLGHDTMCQTVPIHRMHVLVTDSASDPEMRRLLATAGVDVRVVRTA